jgi:hypothetical protein
MRFIIQQPPAVSLRSPSSVPMRGYAFAAAVLLGWGLLLSQNGSAFATQSAPAPTPQKPVNHASSAASARKAAKTPAPEPEPPPPTPKWPANDSPGRASVTWDSHGLRIEASNSSLQQILHEVSLETGTKIEGMGADQRVFGSYGPGLAREVIAQLLAGSGYNVLLAGDLGSGAPREIVLTPRGGSAGARRAPGSAESEDGGNPDDEIPDNSSEVEEEAPPQQPVPMQPNPNTDRPGFGPNGPIRTPQQVMEEMQRQQQQQQQQQQENQPPDQQ